MEGCLENTNGMRIFTIAQPFQSVLVQSSFVAACALGSCVVVT